MKLETDRIVVRRRPSWPHVGMVASAVVASVLTALFIRLGHPSAQEPKHETEKADASVEDVFSIPDSVR